MNEAMRLGGLLGFGVAVFLVSYHYNTRLLEWMRFQSLGPRDYIVDRLNTMFVEVDPQTVLLVLFSCSFGLGLVVFLAFLSAGLWIPGLVFALLLTAVGWKLPRPVVDWFYWRRVDKLVFQMVDGLNLMSNGMKSGLTVVQSMSLVVQEMPNPVQQEFNLVLSENRLGVPLEEAFNNFAKRIRNDDVEMFVTAINILKETGGNLAETFDTITMTIRERIKVQKKIAALTAQGFYQGVFVMAVPPILAVVFYQSDPDFMRPLFTTPLGWVIIMVIITLEVVGFFVIMKVIKIDV